MNSDSIATFDRHTDAVYIVDVFEDADGVPTFVSGDKGEQAIVWQIEKEIQDEEVKEPIQKWKT